MFIFIFCFRNLDCGFKNSKIYDAFYRSTNIRQYTHFRKDSWKVCAHCYMNFRFCVKVITQHGCTRCLVKETGDQIRFSPHCFFPALFSLSSLYSTSSFGVRNLLVPFLLAPCSPFMSFGLEFPSHSSTSVLSLDRKKIPTNFLAR